MGHGRTFIVLLLVLALISSAAAVMIMLDDRRDAPTEREPSEPSSSPASLLIYRDGSETVSKDVPSGAVLFSSADSSEIIQRTIDHASGGGRISVGPGEYHLDRTIRLADNILLDGEGAGTAFYGADEVSFIIDAQENVTLSNFTLLGRGPIVIAGYGEPARGILLKDITATIDSSHEGAFYVLAVDTVVSDITFLRCTALNCGTNGFINNGNYEGGWIENISYLQCRAEGCGLEQRYNDWVVGFDLAERVNIRNMTLQDCVASDNWQSGFHFEPDADLENVVLLDCDARDNGRAEGSPDGDGYGWGYLIYDRPWHDVRLLNCTASGNWRGDTDLGPLPLELVV